MAGEKLEHPQQPKATGGDKVAPAQHSSGSSASDEEAPSRWGAERKPFLQRRRRLVACVCTLATVVILLAVVVIALALTVYRVREPRMTVESISVDRKNGAAGGSLLQTLLGNSTVEIMASVRNPNAVTYYYDRSSTSIYYDGSLLSESPGPTGKALPKRTYTVNVTVHISHFKLDNGLLEKVLSEKVASIDASTMVDGHVKVLGMFRRRVDVLLNCTVGLAVANLTITGQNCQQRVWI